MKGYEYENELGDDRTYYHHMDAEHEKGWYRMIPCDTAGTLDAKATQSSWLVMNNRAALRLAGPVLNCRPSSILAVRNCRDL